MPGGFAFVPSDEDIHTAVERRVTELAGPAGAKLHTGRSRNDQVATDFRLWCKRELPAVARLVLALQEVLLGRADAGGGADLPGYTHLQRAQPVLPPTTSSPTLEPPARPRAAPRYRRAAQRLAARRRCAGRDLAAHRPGGAAERSGSTASPPTASTCSATATSSSSRLRPVAGRHAPRRLGEEWVLWATTSSASSPGRRLLHRVSMMPHKKNPDVLE